MSASTCRRVSQLALGYVPEPPPPGFGTWEDFGRSIGMPEEQFGDQSACVDPEGNEFCVTLQVDHK